MVEGDRGTGAQENRGQEGYGRREEKGREAVFLKWWEPGEKEKNFTILRNISQQKQNKEAGTPTEGAGKGEQRVREAGVSDPLSPPMCTGRISGCKERTSES